MTERISKNIYVIKVPLPGNPLKNLNSYYIRGDRRNLLVDTGFNCDVCYEALRGGLDELGADMGNTDIFLTHLHSDHSGLCARVSSESSKIFVSETDEKYLESFSKDDYWDRLHKNASVLGFSEAELEENKRTNPIRAYAPPRETIYTPVVDGFQIDLGGISLQAVATPGHTPGHMCLYDVEHKTFLSGDHILFDITPNITTWQGVDDSLGLYIESLKKIRKFDVETTLAAHRSATGSLSQRIDELIEHHKSRLDEAFRIVKSSPGLSAYEAASKMKWSIRAKDWSEFPITQKWFAVGEASAHLEHLLGKGIIKKELIDGVYVYHIV